MATETCGILDIAVARDSQPTRRDVPSPVRADCSMEVGVADGTRQHHLRILADSWIKRKSFHLFSMASAHEHTSRIQIHNLTLGSIY